MESNEPQARQDAMNPMARRERVDRACDLFEEQFNAGQQPRIERFLEQADPSDRPLLLAQLLRLELDFHRAVGQRIEFDRYRDRFPDETDIVNLALESFAHRHVLDPAMESTEGDQANEASHVLSGDLTDFVPRDDVLQREVEPDVLRKVERRYVLLRCLGVGGFAVVCLARDKDLDREVALKIPRKGRLARDDQRELFVTEARQAAQLDHPRIVRIHSVHRESDVVYIVQDYINGGDLAGHIKQNRLSPHRSAELLMAVAEAVGFLHRQRYTHLDLKPSNILLDQQGNPYLADFGLTIHEETQRQLAGARMGTWAYMSPEQVRGELHRLDGRSDIWSLGVVLYELLVGNRPFRAKDRQELGEEIQFLDPRPPRQLDPSVPAELSRVCLKCLAKRATDRYQSAADLIDDLRHWLDLSSNEQKATSATGAEPLHAIVPKGLRSFDGADADFFLELLPGPFDRDGLPKGVRFWKTAVERHDADSTFSVGLMYGPSGCGKTSLVKAGLLPRLDPNALAIYVEATADDTEGRLLKGIRRHCPEVDQDTSLPEMLAALRTRGGSQGRKVLLVVDQFEQWLHAREPDETAQLVRALRQCDGAGVQCLVMVRDDFWMSATRFMQALEVPLVEGQNSAAVELFDTRHARKVLESFGRAYDRLPALPAELTSEQTRFLERAIQGLAEGGKVVSVRVAVFAEMMKSREWTERSLREVGGTEGVGVAFLDETFNARTAPPAHRLHEKAVRKVLRVLLPEQGTDIKGRMLSYDELLEASGYEGRTNDFDVLLRILDSDVRLITPSESGESDEEHAEASASRHGPYYQLSHDYLVPAIREWLTRKQKETARGRAELRLTELADAWKAKQENRHLPSLWEYARIRTLTDRRRWAEPERKLMRSAGRLHAKRVALVSCLFLLFALIGNELNGRIRSRILVENLLSAKEDAVLRIVRQMRPYRRWAKPWLQRQLEDQLKSTPQHRSSLHVRIALLADDPSQAKHLRDAVLDSTTPYSYVGVIRSALSPPGNETVSPELIGQFRAAFADGDPDKRFRAGLVLAAYDAPTNDRPADSKHSSWNAGELRFLSERLIAANPEQQPMLRDYLRPMGNALLAPLETLFADSSLPETQQLGAANAVADFASQDAAVLARSLSVATPAQYKIVYASFVESGGDVGETILADLMIREPTNDLLPDERVALGRRRAGASITLLHRGDRKRILNVLRVRDDPESLTQFVHRCRARCVTPTQLLECLDEAERLRQMSTGERRILEDRVLFGLLLALGEYALDEVPVDDQKPLIEQLAAWYANDPSSTIHGATGWLLRHWGQDELARKVDETPIPYAEDRQWYTLEIKARTSGFLGLIGGREVKSHMTFIVIPAGEYEIGSPQEEDGRQPDETRQTVRFDHPFSILDREVTWADFRLFDSSLTQGLRELVEEHTGVTPALDHPVTAIRWYDSVRFCRDFSTRVGLGEGEQAYGNPKSAENIGKPEYAPDPDPVAEGWPLNWPLMGLSRRGLRLPTEAEWEVACRSGSRVAWCVGGDQQMPDRYGWLRENSNGRTHPGRLKRPNLLGLFDMNGNVLEWCHDWHALRDDEAFPSLGLSGPYMSPLTLRVSRGGSFGLEPEDCRSSRRFAFNPSKRAIDLGFRLAQTPSSNATTESPNGAADAVPRIEP